MTDYVHGYGTREQERLVEQAEHWRHRLITNGTALEPGTRLLEVGCGVGAVLAVLGQEFPRIILHGVDIEPKQLAFARGHLERAGVEATLVEADARALPFADQSFDHVWMMWFLEHVADPPEVLREARRVLVPGGAITAIEVDYATCRADPSTPALEALFRAMVQGMAASGWSDADLPPSKGGARVPSLRLPIAARCASRPTPVAAPPSRGQRRRRCSLASPAVQETLICCTGPNDRRAGRARARS